MLLAAHQRFHTNGAGRVGTLLALAALTGCVWDTVAGFPARASRLTPLPVYRTWWAQTEACSGRTGDFDSIGWFTLPASDALINHYDGEWFSHGNRIVLTRGSIPDGELVRHEMLHALLGGNAGHPRSEFLEQCAGVVACIADCITDAGPPPPPPINAVHVPPSALEIHVTVSSRTPSSAVDGGFFSMTITATNSATTPVVVDLPPSGDAGPPVTYSLRASHRSGYFWYDIRLDDIEATYFAAGETKRFIFDFVNQDGPYVYNLAPGSWTLAGAYGDVWAGDSATIAVGP